MNAATRNFAGLLAATGIAAALGLYAYFGVMKPEERETEKKALEAKLVPAGAEPASDGGLPPSLSFTSLSVTRSGETTVLQRRGEAWFITSPLEAKADPVAVEALIDQLTTARVKERLEEHPSGEELARYGLSPPRFTVRGRAHTGNESQAKEFGLSGGVENPFNATVYLRKDGEDAVFSAPAAVGVALAKSTFDLREKRLFELEPTGVARLEVKTGKGGYTLQNDTLGWKVTAPRAFEADKELVIDMLSAFSREHVIGFPVDSPQLRQSVDFDAPELEARIRRLEGGELRFRFATGKDGKRYVLREEGPSALVAEVSEVTAQHLKKTPDELREKSVLRFDRAAATRLVFDPAGPAAPVELLRDPPTDAGVSESWRVVRPQSGPAVAWKVSSLLWALSSLKAKSIAADPPRGLGSYGLEQDATRVQVYGEGGKVLGTLTVGAVSRSDPALVYAKGDLPIVFEVDSNRLTELPTSASGLIDVAAADAGAPPR